MTNENYSALSKDEKIKIITKLAMGFIDNPMPGTLTLKLSANGDYSVKVERSLAPANLNEEKDLSEELYQAEEKIRRHYDKT